MDSKVNQAAKLVVGSVEADGESFGIEDYDRSPEAYATVLSRAKGVPGYALCQCTTPNPKLVIRIARRRLGDYYLLAKWPLQGIEHDMNCRFGRSHSGQGSGNGQRIPAVVETEDGFSIRPDFSLRRLSIGVRKDPAMIRPEVRAQASRPQRAKLGLLGALYYFWETARLNHFSGSIQRTWADVYPRLDNVLAQGTFGKHSLQDTLYLVPPYDAESKSRINQTWDAFVEGRSRTEKVIPMFLVMGEIKEVGSTIFSMVTWLRNHKTPLYMDFKLADAVAARYPSEEAALCEGLAQSRVMGLFLVEQSDNGYLNVQNAALMLCSRDYIPCDSGHEVRLADKMVAEGRNFEKPMFVDESLGMLPDFVDLSQPEPVFMEVWGMNTDKYIERKREKITSYRDKGLRLWQWDAINEKDIPALP